MEANWPFVSWAIFLFGAGILVGTYRTSVRENHSNAKARWYGWLALVAYCLHQSEEHAYDLRGWRYSFVPALNHGPISELYKDLCLEFLNGQHSEDGGNGVVSCPLDPKIVLWVNTILIWGGFGGCMVVAELWPSRFTFAGYLNWGTAVVNGIGGHILPAMLTASYNPGVVQSVCMVPLGIWLIGSSGRPILCLVNGILSHLALALGINIIFRFQTDETITMSILMWIVAVVIPLGISNAVMASSKKPTKQQ